MAEFSRGEENNKNTKENSLKNPFQTEDVKTVRSNFGNDHHAENFFNEPKLEESSLCNNKNTDSDSRKTVSSAMFENISLKADDCETDVKMEHEESDVHEELPQKYDENVEKIYTSNNSDNNDLNNIKNPNQFEPSTSQIDENIDDKNDKIVKFRKLDSSLKKRNYRNQFDSSNIGEDVSSEEKLEPETPNQVLQEESPNEGSDSSESIEFCEELADTSEDSSAASDDENCAVPAVLQKKPPKSDWSILKEISNRQIGNNYSVPTRFYKSLRAIQRLELMYKMEEHLGCVNSLGFNMKGNLLASASDDLSVTIWDWAIGKKHVSIKSGHKSNVFQSKWLPLDIECYLVSSARDGQVRLIDVRNGITRKLANHRGACHKISTHANSPNMILSAGEDSKVFSIDVREKKPSTLLSVKDNDLEVELYSIHTNPCNEDEFCVAGKSRSVKIYDRRKLSTPVYQLYPKHLPEETSFVTCAVYNYNGTEVIASYNNEDIYLFDTVKSYQEGDFAHRYQGHCNNATIKGVNFFGPSSEFILSGSDCGNIFIWDKKTEAIVQWMPGDEQGIVNALEPHPHLPILATSGLDYDIKIWIPSNEEEPNFKKQLQSCVKKNMSVRSNSYHDMENNFDGHILWSLLQDMHRARRRRQYLSRSRNSDQNVSIDESNHISDSEYLMEDSNESDLEDSSSDFTGSESSEV